MLPRAVNIADAMDRLIAGSRLAGGPDIEFYNDIPIERLPPNLHAAMSSIIQELVTNACRHGKSKRVLVGLAQDDELICLQVQDWGIGFDPASVSPSKSGLRAIRQLIQWHGGSTNVDSRPGAGTCITVEIPLVQATESDNQPGDRSPG